MLALDCWMYRLNGLEPEGLPSSNSSRSITAMAPCKRSSRLCRYIRSSRPFVTKRPDPCRNARTKTVEAPTRCIDAHPLNLCLPPRPIEPACRTHRDAYPRNSSVPLSTLGSTLRFRRAPRPQRAPPCSTPPEAYRAQRLAPFPAMRTYLQAFAGHSISETPAPLPMGSRLHFAPTSTAPKCPCAL